jgi:hypothetical protein
MPFALVCLAALAAPLAPRLTGHAWAPLGELVPLALMLLCGTILYIEASRDAFVAPPDASSVAKAMTGFANSMSRRAGGVLASHIVVGSGAWIALLGAGYLTLRGLGSARGAR